MENRRVLALSSPLFSWSIALSSLLCVCLAVATSRPHALTDHIRPAERKVPVSPARKASEAINPGNPAVVEIQNPELSGYRRILVLSDVHGMYSEIWHLLMASDVIDMAPAPVVLDGKQAETYQWSPEWKGTGTLLIVTGDSIDKGPQSLEVLKLWSDLQRKEKNNNRIVVLLGNHEAEFLAEPGNKKASSLQQELIGQGYRPDDLADIHFTTHDGYPLGRFLRSMPLAARVGQWLFCHAGWIPDPKLLDASRHTSSEKWKAFVSRAQDVVRNGRYSRLVASEEDAQLADPQALLAPMLIKKVGRNGKKWWKSEVPLLEARLTEYGLYGVVFGHQPKAFEVEDGIGISAHGDYRLVKVDSGMAFPDAPKDGDPTRIETWQQPYMGHMLRFPSPIELAQEKMPPQMEVVGFSKKPEVSAPVAVEK